MAAELIPARPGEGFLHHLRLPPPAEAAGALDEVRFGLGSGPTPRGPLRLETGAWELDCEALRQLTGLLLEHGLEPVELIASCPTTLVAASALGLDSRWPAASGQAAAPGGAADRAIAAAQVAATETAADLLIHRGTLRSGDHLQSEGSVLLLGDVNPGARISAGGHVLVWGRLRGVAHAGRTGDSSARIVALQLRPLQLRIAAAVARGPEDSPPEGLAEEARLENGEIRIEPASPSWPRL